MNKGSPIRMLWRITSDREERVLSAALSMSANKAASMVTGTFGFFGFMA